MVGPRPIHSVAQWDTVPRLVSVPSSGVQVSAARQTQESGEAGLRKRMGPSGPTSGRQGRATIRARLEHLAANDRPNMNDDRAGHINIFFFFITYTDICVNLSCVYFKTAELIENCSYNCWFYP